MGITQRIALLRSELGPVRLVVVTKGRTPQEILEVLETGVMDIGENRLQETEEKFAQLKDHALFQKCTKHFIGHMQSNKAAQIAELFDVVQSVDSLKIAEKLSAAAQRQRKKLTVFLQVNATGEAQKHGCRPSDAPKLAVAIPLLPNLHLVGLMGMGPQGSEEEIRHCFQTLRKLQRELQLPELSMGMSNDYKIALQEGATMVRIGSALFEL